MVLRAAALVPGIRGCTLLPLKLYGRLLSKPSSAKMHGILEDFALAFSDS